MVYDGQRSVPQGAFSYRVRVRLAVSIAIDGQLMPTQLRSGRPMVVVALAQQESGQLLAGLSKSALRRVTRTDKIADRLLTGARIRMRLGAGPSSTILEACTL